MDSKPILRADYYYVGSFDDEILRYNDSDLDLDAINITLAQAALFGSPLLINDGQLMLYPDGRQALTESDSSPLNALIDAHYVKLFSRNHGDLAGMPEQMSHIPSYVALLRNPSWQRATMPMLKDNQARWRDNRAIVDWPAKDTSVGFRRLINIAFEGLKRTGFPHFVTDNQATDLLSSFNHQLDRDSRLAARTTWTTTYNDPHLAFSSEAKSYLHWIGIEAYHYNMGMVSSSAMGGNLVPGLITRYSNLFSGIRATPCEQDGGASAVELPRPTVPMGIRNEWFDGKFLAEIVGGGILTRKKADYLTTLESASRDRYFLSEAKQAAREYGDAIAKALHKENNKRGQQMIESFVGTAMGAAGGYYLGLHPLLSCSIGSVIAKIAAPYLNEIRFKATHRIELAVDLIEPFEPPKSPSLTLPFPREPHQWVAPFPLNPLDTQIHCNELPAFG